jgi:hypothetical protein
MQCNDICGFGGNLGKTLVGISGVEWGTWRRLESIQRMKMVAEPVKTIC